MLPQHSLDIFVRHGAYEAVITNLYDSSEKETRSLADARSALGVYRTGPNSSMPFTAGLEELQLTPPTPPRIR